MSGTVHIFLAAQLDRRLVDAVPQGTNWIANGRTKTYYQVGCPEAARIAPADRLFYGSESSLKAAGFKRAQEC
jgi:hypothetical protein